MIVGTQIDLRKDEAMIENLSKNRKRPLSTAAGERLQSEVKAVGYVECSALTQVQWFPLENQQSPFYVVNEVTLTR